MLREDFLFQNAYDAVDAYTSLKKQYRIIRAILRFMDLALPLIESEDFDFKKLRSLPVRDEIAKAHFIPEAELSKFDNLESAIAKDIATLGSPATK
jgi:V/A-type H+-transporting ATPase subunit A